MSTAPIDADPALAAVYRERAAALAHREGATSQPVRGERVILFALGEETYGLPIRIVDRVFAQPVRVPMPGVGRRWAGVFAVQGEIVPILNLAHVLELPEAQTADGECVLSLRTAGRRLGLLTGRALAVREIPMDSLRGIGNRTRYVRGISEDNELILDADLLAEQEFSK